jgi:hypothetical protein
MNSVFDELDAPGEHIYSQPRSKMKLLPRYCGTYAFYDRLGQLLYIGKAKNIRARILEHLREDHSAGLFPKWTHLVGRIEARLAHSETEALLVEADLIAKARPGFNRRMKTWRKYCYLVETGEPSAPFSISLQVVPWKQYFGPYRSRRQAVRIIEALHFVFRQNDAGDDMFRRVRDLLSGRDDALVDELERRCESCDNPEGHSLAQEVTLGYGDILRRTHMRGRLLREAATAWGGLTLISHVSEILTFAFVSSAGLHLRRISADIDGTEALLRDYCRMVAHEFSNKSPVIPKRTIDLLCLIAQGARRPGRQLSILSSSTALKLSAAKMLALFNGINSSGGN